MRNDLPMVLAVLFAAVLVGCDGLQKPEARVTRVALAERTPEGLRVEMTVAVVNPNDTPLPVRWADYAVEVDEVGAFAFEGMPAVTLPPNGTQTFTLAAAFADGEAPVVGRAYRVSGAVGYEPPGEVRELFTQYGVPLPAVEFGARGELEASLEAGQ